MPDAPDWYNYRLETNRHILGDLAEHAVRLGSIDQYDRRGTVVDIDNFEFGLSQWVVSTYGAGAYGKVVTSPTFKGGFALELRSGTDDALMTKINKNFSIVRVGKIGAEIAFRPSSGGNYFLHRIYYDDGDDLYEAEVKVDLANQELLYMADDDTYTKLADIDDLGSLTQEWHIIKLVGDFDNLEYVRVMLNDQTYDMSGIALETSASGGNPYLQYVFLNYGVSGTAMITNVDCFILTMDEP